MNYKKPTVQLLGRFQPFHDGHYELFKKALEKTGQVCIMVRDTGGNDLNNPYSFRKIKKGINKKLKKDFKGKYIILKVPNIVNISYGRGVGYKIEEIDLPDHIKKISATEIRNKNN